ncbi:HAD-IA family hydrolase [archaeon]|nr:HAD-IA family hydrolase [archaeon]MBL7056963.1 HAD-IA family hydrolase [Candidatus Woesearchaeota archaeon]
MIKAIIFDLWGTLGSKKIGLSSTLRKHFNIKKTSNFIRLYEESIQLHDWKTNEAMAESFLKFFKVPITKENIAFFIKTVEDGLNISYLLDGMKELLEILSKEYRLVLLSNTNNMSTNILTQWGVRDLFTKEIFSCYIGSLKPSKKNFDIVCEELNVKYEECIFTDDMKENIIAANSLGIKGIHFKSVSQLKEDLKALGVKIDYYKK